MMQFGEETETKTLDQHDSTVSVTTRYHNFEPKKLLRKHAIRKKVLSKQEEMTEYLTFTDMIELKRKTGELVISDTDPTTKPSFIIEYPKNNIDDSYFIVMMYTENIA